MAINAVFKIINCSLVSLISKITAIFMYKVNSNLRHLAAVLVAIIVLGCGGDDDGSPNSSNGNNGNSGLNPTAEYTVTFSTEFSEEEYPEDYPNNASFGTIVAIIHSPELSIYEVGQLASDGFASYVASGDVDGLASFLSSQGGEQNEGQFVIQTEGSIDAVGTKTFTLTFTPERTRVTFLAKLNPSPDWFLGASSLDIVDGIELKNEVTSDLILLDGGTRSGTTYDVSTTAESNNIGFASDAPFANGSPFSNTIGSFEMTRN